MSSHGSAPWHSQEQGFGAAGNRRRSPSPTPAAETRAPAVSRQLCDPRLREVDIGLWTNVAIDDETAARCVSLYLETDHPLLGHFDPELFVSHLTSGRGEHCSSLLVNALLYWACVDVPVTRAARGPPRAPSPDASSSPALPACASLRLKYQPPTWPRALLTATSSSSTAASTRGWRATRAASA